MAKAIESARRPGLVSQGDHLHRRYKDKVKLTFAKGASLPDPSGLFNSSLDGSVRRAIDIHENSVIDEEALKALIRAAVALNASAQANRQARTKKKSD